MPSAEPAKGASEAMDLAEGSGGTLHAEIWCPCWATVPEPTGPWQYPDDEHADVCDVLLSRRRATSRPEFTREQVRKALAEADSSGYQRGRNEALMEAIGLAERRGAKATAGHLRQRYESYQEACRER